VIKGTLISVHQITNHKSPRKRTADQRPLQEKRAADHRPLGEKRAADPVLFERRRQLRQLISDFF
jgi:hypothetical protein